MNNRMMVVAVAVIVAAVAQAETLKLTQAEQVAPRSAWDAGSPVINGPRVFGATPGRDFTFTFPVRGSRDGLAFAVVKGSLPKGVALDPRTGVLSGRTDAAGEHRFTVEAKNAEGAARIDFTLEIGADRLQRTPLLGWTSWNALCSDPTQERVLEQASLLKARGLAARGYLFVNIDTGWQGDRADPMRYRISEGTVTNAMMANSRFRDMGGFVAAIHRKGLKAGIYTSPMVCAWGTKAARTFRGTTDYPLDPKFFFDHFGGIGQVVYEREDARQFAKWGFDYLKYDWALDETNHVHSMRAALDATDRDILLCICQPSSIENNADAYERCAQLHRIGGDVADEWKEIADYVHHALPWLERTRPGCWGDLDMLGIGRFRVRRTGYVPCYTPIEDPRYDNRLTRDEAITHFLFWAVAPSPIQLSFDLSVDDSFIFDLVSNEELLAINQDYPFSGPVFRKEGGVLILERKLSDGRTVRGAFNFGDEPANVAVALPAVQLIRDPLSGRELGETDRLEFTLRPHASRVVTTRAKL